MIYQFIDLPRASVMATFPLKLRRSRGVHFANLILPV